jgi:hypothetical protein
MKKPLYINEKNIENPKRGREVYVREGKRKKNERLREERYV